MSTQLHERYRPRSWDEVVGQPIERYVKLAQSCKNNLRGMLSAIEAGEMVEG